MTTLQDLDDIAQQALAKGRELESRRDPPMMKCGHAANAVNGHGKPSCVICVGIHPGAEVVDEDVEIAEGRIAKCFDCKKEAPSSTALPFFEHRSDSNRDNFYCGCRGM